MENLENLKYKDLQKLAKEAGIRANSPKAVLIEALKGVQTPSEERGGNEEPSTSTLEQSKLNETFEKIDVEAQNKLNETFEKVNVLDTTFDKNESMETVDESKEGSRFVEFMDDGQEEISFRRSSRVRGRRSSTPISSVKTKPRTPAVDYLSKKNKTPLRKTSRTPNSIQKKSEIPRFVKFANAQKVKSSARKVPNFAKLHEKNFKKMESLDDYVEKKKKLTDTVTKLMDKSRQLTREHTNIVMQVKSKLKFAPAVTSVDKMNLNFGNQPTSTQGAQPFKFSAKSDSKTAPLPKVLPKERKDIKTTRTTKMGKRNNTLNVDKESDAKPLLNITNTNKSMNNTNKSMNQTKTPSKKFDLAASLAKPLTYQPHKGKLKPLEKKRKDFTQSFETRTNEEAKKKQMVVIKGVRMNKRAELMMMRRKNSN